MVQLLKREEGEMKKGYWVVAYRTVGDEAMMSRYLALAIAALGQFSARTLVSSRGAVTPYEAGLKQMTVVVEFDSYVAALAAYESEDYKKALAVLGPEVERDFRIAEGA
jgi:uncharacterized protein (DUF1330 family)